MKKTAAQALLAWLSIAILCGCELLNHAPTVALEFDTSLIYPGEIVEISSNALDPDDDLLTHQWTVNDLDVYGASIDSLSFRAPVDGIFSIGIEVSDLLNATVSATIDLIVQEPFDLTYSMSKLLLGDWLFVYTIISIWSDEYSINRLSRGVVIDGFYAAGENQWDDPIIATYDIEYGDYSLLDSGTIIDKFFIFEISNNLAAGSYYKIDNSDNSWSNAFPMSGVRYQTWSFSPSSRQRREERDVEVVPEAGRGHLPPEEIKSRYNQLKARKVFAFRHGVR